jgi:hypothetical protein
VLVLPALSGSYPFLQKFFAGGGYQGPGFQKASAKILPNSTSKSSNALVGRKSLSFRREVVCRAQLGVPNRCRRLAKDFENLTQTHSLFHASSHARKALSRGTKFFGLILEHFPIPWNRKTSLDF